jgi:hypothetical protein
MHDDKEQKALQELANLFDINFFRHQVLFGRLDSRSPLQIPFLAQGIEQQPSKLWVARSIRAERAIYKELRNA